MPVKPSLTGPPRAPSALSRLLTIPIRRLSVDGRRLSNGDLDRDLSDVNHPNYDPATDPELSKYISY